MFSAWVLWNYINDDFWHLFRSQLWFSATEFLVVSVLALYVDARRGIGAEVRAILLGEGTGTSSDSDNKRKERESVVPMYSVIALALAQIFFGGLSQAFANLFSDTSNARSHLYLRDSLFFWADCLTVGCCTWETRRVYRAQAQAQRRSPHSDGIRTFGRVCTHVVLTLMATLGLIVVSVWFVPDIWGGKRDTRKAYIGVDFGVD